ncbi:hypothetical protein SKAU_G00033640 [Synaphobranchus kaupii]|uniref:Uncharacterized protein n=1 Tax=Synaphobranchus kaupii TaxID=118154 RepID=A0A9Q1JDF6_SYNKA|nr:hypothetical protein SKAU_G00033640 [Synaphobranchus kaupii]
MGNNIECYEAYHVGRDVGLIPDPQMDRAFTGYLSLNSSAHLSSHYIDVRHSLSPEQLGTFNHSLRATLGESGKVTQGGVGVVALALSLLFDTLAQQAKNQTETTHFIHKIFGERVDGNSSEIGTVVTNYLKLVPLIANDPQRMKEETNRYEQRLHRSLVSHFESAVMLQNSSCTAWKILFYGIAFHQHMMIHQAYTFQQPRCKRFNGILMFTELRSKTHSATSRHDKTFAVLTANATYYYHFDKEEQRIKCSGPSSSILF